VTGLGTKRYGFHYTVVYATIHPVVVRISYLKTPTPLAPRLCQLYSVVTRRLFQLQLAQTITTPCMHQLEMFVTMSGGHTVMLLPSLGSSLCQKVDDILLLPLHHANRVEQLQRNTQLTQNFVSIADNSSIHLSPRFLRL
jgi:hypothetical protein